MSCVCVCVSLNYDSVQVSYLCVTMSECVWGGGHVGDICIIDTIGY